MVTVVDAPGFLRDYRSGRSLADVGETAGAGDDRDLVELLVQQVEFANILVLNKTDLVSSEELMSVKGILRSLNPEAEIIESTFGKVALDKLMNTGLFSMTKAANAPGWLKVLRGQELPETDEYGISSFVFRAREPFHPERLWSYLQAGAWKKVLRSKGYFWLATRPDAALGWSQAGDACRIEPGGKWWAAVDESEWPVEESLKSKIRKSWDSQYGDRKQELVFIGQNVDKELVKLELEKCLVSKVEMENISSFSDPFPDFALPVDEVSTAEAK